MGKLRVGSSYSRISCFFPVFSFFTYFIMCDFRQQDYVGEIWSTFNKSKTEGNKLFNEIRRGLNFSGAVRNFGMERAKTRNLYFIL